MASKLATQLAQNTSLNASLLNDKSRRRSTDSYLFTGREADQHDLQSIHALGVNGLLQLKALSPPLQSFEDSLFSDAVRDLDRTLLDAEANAELDRNIEAFLALLGPYLLEAPTGRLLEWLVRRFRINEFNVDNVLALFLPYHESPHFAKMLTILHIKPQSTWSFLIPFKSAAQIIPRSSLVTEMLNDTDIARFIVALLPNAIKGGYAHRTLVAFNAATIHDYITRSKILDQGTLAFLLPALLEPLNRKSASKDSILGSYILLATLSRKCHLTPKALSAIITSMTTCAPNIDKKQFVNAIVSVCEPQDELDAFSEYADEAILRIPGIKEEIKGAMIWEGIEKFVCPLIASLERRLNEESASDFLESIISAKKVPSVILRQLCTMLLKHVVSNKDEDSTVGVSTARRLLTHIQQRHPAMLENVVEKEVGSWGDDLTEAVDDVVVSLSMPSFSSHDPQSTNNLQNMILASSSASAQVRTKAVDMLQNALNTVDLPPSDVESIHSALLARTQDRNINVLEQLFSKPTILTPILDKGWQSYVTYLTHTLAASKPKASRPFRRTHFAFLTQFCEHSKQKEILEQVFNDVFFSSLLYSKPRQHTAKLAWEIIAASGEGGIGSYELLAGCGDVWKTSKKDGLKSTREMGSLNMALVARIAQNILLSNGFSKHLDHLVMRLRDTDSHTRLLGLLITRVLMGRLSGEKQIDAAHKILTTINFEQLGDIGDSSQESEKLHDILAESNLGSIVVKKPSSQTTTHLLQASIVVSMPLIPRPTKAVLDWFANLTHDKTTNHRFVDIMQAVYRLANSATFPSSLRMEVLRGLFLNLKDDTLTFLAGIWTNASEENHGTALHHAAAFLEANKDAPNHVDFQTILPSIIVALRSDDISTRKGAVMCIRALVLFSEKSPTTVYGFDTIYGESSTKLQYLDWEDFIKYLAALEGQGEHFSQDPAYVDVFHQRSLAKSTVDKKDNGYRQRVLCYILSHVNSIGAPHAKLSLLKIIKGVSDQTKAQVLLPTIQDLVGKDSDMTTLVTKFGPHAEEFYTLVLSCLDGSASNDFNDSSSLLWPTFIQSLRHCFLTESMVAPRQVLAAALERGLFTALNLERKLEVCELLLKVAAGDTDVYINCKNLLTSILQDVPVIVRLLTSFQPTADEDGTRVTKRAKLEGSAQDGSSEDTITSLTLLAEVLGSVTLVGSMELVSRLLETLNKVLQHASASQADLSYIVQLLMSAVENAADKVAEAPNLAPSAIRLDILVELIRVAENPQTFHQALLLVASLARLAPDSVVHNVMPVFTFMGSNVFHRDDSYSFRVVQKTIDSIVPVVVSSLKSQHSSRLDLYIGSRDFLRIFTDAAIHIPRHRRTSFFSHLVDVLGQEEFLAPVCVLLVDKVANRAIRQSAEDAQNAFNLPVAVLQHYPPSVQVYVLTEVLRESQRLLSHALDPESHQPLLLEVSTEEEYSLPTSTTFGRRAQALITFVGHAIRPTSTTFPNTAQRSGSINDLVLLLIDVATVKAGILSDAMVDGISNAARCSLDRAVGVMRATDFIAAVLTMLESDECRIQAGALGLLTDRLPTISDAVRHEITPTVVKVVDSIRRIISLNSEDPVTTSAFRALKTIGLTMCAGEESSLTDAIPPMITAIEAQKNASSAITALAPLSKNLGPRIIPHLLRIVAACTSILRQPLQESATIADDTLTVLHGLIVSVPTFWGSKEITEVVTLYIHASNAQPHAMASLMKVIAKKAPSKTLLTTLCSIWPDVTPHINHLDQLSAFFRLLKRVLHNAPRPVVLEHLRPLFAVFLESFDVSKDSLVESAKPEAEAISAFIELVVKLNEAAFRPLFRRLYDWAFLSEMDSNSSRKITFCHVYVALLDFFKNLMSAYMSFLLQPFIEILDAFSTSLQLDRNLWTAVIETLSKSFTFDDGAFWQDRKLQQITPTLIEQVAVCVKLNVPDGKALLPNCLSALTDCVTDDGLLKSINLSLLMHSRSEDARLRLFALICTETLWLAHGGKFLGFVAETTTFIAECAEDENDTIVRQCHKLKDAVESVAGSIGL